MNTPTGAQWQVAVDVLDWLKEHVSESDSFDVLRVSDLLDRVMEEQ